MDIIIALHRILSNVKGFTVGYKNINEEQCIIEYEGKRYLVTFDEFDEPADDFNEDVIECL